MWLVARVLDSACLRDGRQRLKTEAEAFTRFKG